MDVIGIKNYINIIENLNDEDYIYAMILYYSAPTLYEIKPSNLITFTSFGRNSYKLWHKYKEYIIKKIPLKVLEIKDNGKTAVVLFYNIKNLRNVIYKDLSMDFLARYQYNRAMNLDDLFNHLRERFKEGCPHEVGIFLGIPVDDVKEYIKNDGKNYLACGYWKVYSNLEKSLEIFSMFDESRRRVLKTMIS